MVYGGGPATKLRKLHTFPRACIIAPSNRQFDSRSSLAAWRSSDRLDEVVYTGTGPAESLQRANLRIYTPFVVNMTRWCRWDKGASGATQMMQCAQAAQGWGHARELIGTTYFIYPGCFMQRAVCQIHTAVHSSAPVHSVANYGYPGIMIRVLYTPRVSDIAGYPGTTNW